MDEVVKVQSVRDSNTYRNSHDEKMKGGAERPLVVVDWLSISEKHPAGGLPVWGEDCLLKYDLATGETLAKWITGYQHPGSYDSSLRVRCDGSRVEVSGNPSRWNRPDNVWGFETVQEAAVVYDRVLESLGLPPFDHEGGEVVRRTASGLGIALGARISRVDLACNYSLGEAADVSWWLRWLSSYCWRGRPGEVYPKTKLAETAAWYGSKRVVVKWYNKAAEMRAHGSGAKEVMQYLEMNSAVRYEIELMSRELTERGLWRLGAWDRVMMSELMCEYDWTERMQIGEFTMDKIEKRLIESGVSVRTAHAVQGTVMLWQSGYDIRALMSQATWYRHRSLVLKYLGIDISQAMNVDRLPLKCRVVKPAPLSIPDWYQRPRVA